jgi:hypothetical protein
VLIIKIFNLYFSKIKLLLINIKLIREEKLKKALAQVARTLYVRSDKGIKNDDT